MRPLKVFQLSNMLASMLLSSISMNSSQSKWIPGDISSNARIKSAPDISVQLQCLKLAFGQFEHRFKLSYLSMEMQFTLHRPLYRTMTMTMIPKLKIAMSSMSYLPPLIILPEDQRSVESVVSMRNIQNVYSNARDVMRLGIRVGLVVKQLIIKSVA